MLLLTGVPRQSFWAAYFLSHLGFFCLAWTIGYLHVLSGMNGVMLNSPVAYFALALSAGPTFIVYGYLLFRSMICAVPSMGWQLAERHLCIAWMIPTLGRAWE